MNDYHPGDMDIQAELERTNAVIDGYTMQIDALDEAIAAIEEENRGDDVSRQIEEYQLACERDPANIPAEDALDMVTRLQNSLKIIKRRNQLLARENATQEKLLRDRSSTLMKLTVEQDKMVVKTGWHEQLAVDFSEQEQQMNDVAEMRQIEATVRKELRAAQVIIKKKEKTILSLEAQVEKGNEIDAAINNIYNDIRVKQRDIREAELRLEQMRRDDAKNDRALTAYESSAASASLAYMENDKEFLRDAVVEMKRACRQQSEVTKAQMDRQQQLHSRLETIMRSMRDMKLEKEYERNVSKSALVPSASREEPDDVSKILPAEEFIPIHTYRLLYKNNEMMRTIVARKNMLVLEKESVTHALQANLDKYAGALKMTMRQQEQLKGNKEMEMDGLMDELQQQHQNYLRQLEHIMQENNQLKKKLKRSPPPIATVKTR